MFVSVFHELKALVERRMAEGFPHPTYFEWLYLMAMIWFGRQHIEYGVIETGLGGRLDATNLIEHPALTVITSISYDHMEILGETLTEIAGEKAGIIKKGVPVICDGSEPETLAVIVKAAENLQCPIQIIDPKQIKNILNYGKNIDFLLEDMYDEKYSIHLNTAAAYQMMNASLALTAIKQLQQSDVRLQNITDETLLAGLSDMHWPGRLEEILPGVYVDGAHNVGGIRSLTDSLKQNFAGMPLWLVFAVASDKDYRHMIEILCTLPDLKGVIVTELDNSRKTDIASVASIFEKNWHGYVGHSYNINEAIVEGRKKAGSSGILLCAGSLYLAGSVLEALGGQADD
jgi:dihydrofolate synthase/folylpolyglutamate synthase